MAVTVRVFEVVTGGGVHGGDRDSEDEWKERKKEKKKMRMRILKTRGRK